MTAEKLTQAMDAARSAGYSWVMVTYTEGGETHEKTAYLKGPGHHVFISGPHLIRSMRTPQAIRLDSIVKVEPYTVPRH